MPELTGAEGYLALTEKVGRVAIERDLVRAHGPDTIRFLHSQLSQDLVGMAAGDCRPSFLLQPQGRFVALLEVERIDDETVALWVDRGFGAPVLEALNRFKIRTKCDLTLAAVHCWAVRGECAEHAGPWARWRGFDVSIGEAVMRDILVGVATTDHRAPDPQEALLGVPVVSTSVFEAVRVERGIPRNGAEILEKTIPGETGLVEVAVSFSKGCYVGQELVERIDARGHVNRHLRGITIGYDGDRTSPLDLVGATMTSGGKAVGQITSAALHPVRPEIVALGYLRREVELGSEIQITVPPGPLVGAVSAVSEQMPGVARAL